jgi:hypothetical protein
VRERGVGAFIVKLVPFDAPAAGEEVASMASAFFAGLPADDVILLHHEAGMLPFGLRDHAERQHGVRIGGAEQAALGDGERDTLHIGHGELLRIRAAAAAGTGQRRSCCFS